MNAIVIATIVKASLLIVAAGAVNVLLRRRMSAASRHLVWTLALSGVLLLPVLSLAIPSWGIPIHVPEDTASVMTSDSTLGASALELTTIATTAASTSTGLIASPAVESASGSASRATPFGEVPWTNVVVAVYVAGVVLLGLRLTFGSFALLRVVRQSAEVRDPSWCGLLRECESKMGVSHPVRLLRSLDRNMPMAFGVRTPTILIPAIADTWSQDRRRAVLLHELAHIDRRDCMTQLLAEVTCAAYWMHPGVWWMAQRLRVERELACDDRVISVGTVARDYAAHLLELAYTLGGYRSPALVVSMARPRQLEGRMLAVLDAARNRVSPPLRARVVGLFAAAALVLPLAAAEAVVVSDSPQTPALVASTTPALPAVAVEPQPVVRAASASQATPASRPAPAVRPTETKWTRSREIALPGTWELRPSDEPSMVRLRLSDRPNSTHGFTIAANQLDGFSPSLLTGQGGAATFNLRRDAGTLVFSGVFQSRVGAGTFDFTPSQTFPAEMVKRGFQSPTATEQYQLARGEVGFAYLDELNAQKYDRPSLDELVRAADHGVSLNYLQGMGSAGYRLGQIGALVRTRDHGVTPAYVREMSDEGVKNLTVEQLVRARDHGVTPKYVGTLRGFGYTDLPIDELIKARDHGVSADYVRGMAALGPERLTLDELVRARDHGVNPDFAKAMRDSGFGEVSINELVKARDHGVSANYLRDMAAFQPERPSLDDFVKARDHGVGPEFVSALQGLGYKPMLDEVIKARDHGVNAEYVEALRDLGYERLSIDDFVRLRDHGVSVSFVREHNAKAARRLTVDELVRRRDGRY